MNVAIVGAGIAGITTAYYLSKKGYSVTIFEEELYPAMRTSFANGGQVSVSNSEVWTTWNSVLRAIKWIGKKDAPFLIRPSLDFDKAVWLAKFLFASASNNYARNTATTIKMGIESRKLYHDIVAKEQIEFDKSDCGILHFYKNEKYWDNAILVKEMYNASGCEWELLDTDKMKSIDKNLMDIKNVIGAVFTSDDFVGDIHKFCFNMTPILKNKYRVNFINRRKITDLNELVEEYDKVIVCAGVGSKKLSKTIGDNLSIYPVKGYSITINLDDIGVKFVPKVSLLDDEAKIVTSTLGNRFRVAGTAELAGENYDIRRDRIEPLINWVHTNFPKLNTHDYSSWACLRPMTPNMMPITKVSDNNKDVIYNTGHGHLGWTLAPVTATKVLGMIDD